MKKTLFFLLISNLLLSQWSISNAERDALINIYNSTDGENWNRTWDLNKDPKLWFGVLVKNGIVTELSLSNNALKGNLPSFISSLRNLKKLDLSNNQLSGDIPLVFSSLTGLEKLDLSNNRFTNDPSNAIISLSNLSELGLGGNKFNVSDVNNLLQPFGLLTYLNLSDFGLTHIPTKILSFTSLTELVLNNNPIAFSDYANLTSLKNLKSLSVSGNKLEQLPISLFTITNLRTLDLSNNLLSEQSFSPTNHKLLEWLSLENNQFTQVPQLSNLLELKNLNLGRNKISGGLSNLASLQKLQQLFLNNNQLTGNFPSKINDLQNLQFVCLNSNQLSGELPLNLPAVTQISNNRFSKTQISNFYLVQTTSTDLEYNPQRYDQSKTVLAVAGESAKLDQSLSGNYTFSWYKNLDQNISNSSEHLTFNTVEENDFATYTVEAYAISTIRKNRYEFSFFREPITLGDALGTASYELKEIYIYPNPTKDFVNIYNNKSKLLKMVIYDLTGKQVLVPTSEKINVSRLPSGTYILSIQTNNGNKNFKFIKV